jgi:hypothetical protein
MISTAARRAPALHPWINWLRRELEVHRVGRGQIRAQTIALTAAALLRPLQTSSGN